MDAGTTPTTSSVFAGFTLFMVPPSDESIHLPFMRFPYVLAMTTSFIYSETYAFYKSAL